MSVCMKVPVDCWTANMFDSVGIGLYYKKSIGSIVSPGRFSKLPGLIFLDSDISLLHTVSLCMRVCSFAALLCFFFTMGVSRQV